jgi:hypothetical protein
MRQLSELRESDSTLQLPPLEPPPPLFLAVELINEFLIALQHGLIKSHLPKKTLLKLVLA